MIETGSLFLGSVGKMTQRYLHSVFVTLKSTGKFDRLVIPCAGQFSIATVAVLAGWKKEDIWCSDVSLFTAVLSSYLNGEEAPEVKFLGEPPPYDLGDQASLLFFQKLLTVEMQAKQYYQMEYVRELRSNAKSYILRIRKQLNLMKEQIGGIHYEGCDLWKVLNREIVGDKTLIFLAPPSYKAGYEKMFDTGGQLVWEEAPAYSEFDPKVDYLQVYKRIMSAQALGLLLVYDIPSRDCWKNALCVERTDWGKNGGILLCNRPKEVDVPKSILGVRGKKFGPSKFPVLPFEQSIGRESKIEMHQVEGSTAMYYRDLFAHGLGMCASSASYLFTVDGFIFGVVGIGGAFDRNYRAQVDGKRYATEMYAFTAPSRFSRLNRLLKMLLLAEEARAQIDKPEKLKFFAGLSSTCISKYPEFKVHRGIFQLVVREKMDDGRYKLRYRAFWSGKTFEEVLGEWVKKYGMK